MRSTTGIELGPDSCVLVRARAREHGSEVAAVRVLAADDWPEAASARIERLRSVRRAGGFPKRARVVAWDLQAGHLDAAALRRLLRDAGFRPQAVLTPPQALAALAASRPRSSPAAAAAWLSVNTHGAAIAIVRGEDVLFSRTVRWSAQPPAGGVRHQLLHRYSLVAHLAPEVIRGMAAVRQAHHVPVEAIVTCGNLPDLRSLTMPLIEELDLEVETLDSLDGLRVSSPALADQVAELAPVLRLACGAAVARVTAPAASRRRLAAVAALSAGLGVAGMLAFTGRSVVLPVPDLSGPLPPAPPSLPPAEQPSVPPPAAAGAIREPEEPPALSEPPPAARGIRQPEATPTVSEPPVAAEKEAGAPSSAVRRPQTVTAAPKPLDAPLPRVTSIVLGQGRQLAIVDGKIVSPGDAVGPRTVLRIEADAVILREPSGLEVRVALRPTAPDEVKSPPFAERGAMRLARRGGRPS